MALASVEMDSGDDAEMGIFAQKMSIFLVLMDFKFFLAYKPQWGDHHHATRGFTKQESIPSRMDIKHVCNSERMNMDNKKLKIGIRISLFIEMPQKNINFAIN